MTFSEMNWLDRILFLKRLKTESGILKTVTGNPISVSDALAAKIKSLTVSLSPIQDLHGQDSPYPAGGGKNKFNPDTITTGYYLDSNGDAQPSAGWCYSDYIPVIADGSIAISGYGGVGNAPRNCWYDSSKIFISAFEMSATSTIVSVPSNAAYLRISVRVGKESTTQLEKGSTATDFAPYENICPISGRTEVTVVRTGKNLFDLTKTVSGILTSTGRVIAGNGTVSDFIFVKAGSYYISRSVATSWWKVAYYDSSKTFASMRLNDSTSTGRGIIIPNDGYIRIGMDYVVSASDEIQLEFGSAKTEYAPGTVASVDVQLGQTVYGGTVDFITGVMMATWAGKELGSMTWAKNGTRMLASNGLSDAPAPTISTSTIPNAKTDIYTPQKWSNVGAASDYTFCAIGSQVLVMDSRYTDTAAFKTAVQEQGVMIAYALATPLTIQLTPTQLSTLKGQNNVWSDGDDVTMTYKAVAE